jgi:uncharacterized protein (TIRG00374 family)
MQPKHKSPVKKRKVDRLQVFLIALSVAIIMYLVLTYNIKEAIDSIIHIKPMFLVLILGAWILFSITKFLPWFYVTYRLKIKIPLRDSLPISLIFFGLEAIPSGMAQLLPLRELDKFKKHGRKFSFSIILSLNMTSALTLIAITMITSILVSKFVVYLIAIFVTLYVLSSLLRFDFFHRFVEWVAQCLKVDEGSLGKHIHPYLKKLRENRNLMSQKNIISEMILFVPTILSEALILYLILLAFNQTLSFIATVFVFSFSFMLATISFVFVAGFGPADLSMIALMLAFGVPGVIAISSLLLFRFFNTVLYILTAYVYFYIYRFFNRNKEYII